jgi:pheromone shutdown protein TraB
MVKALRNLKGKVVAVVGLAHMDGMEQLWQQANEKYLSGQ